MINMGALGFGQAVYSVGVDYHYSRKKTIMTDADGVEWYRYDKPLREYKITELIFCGTLKYSIEGEISDPDEYFNEFHFKYPDGDIAAEYESETNQIEDWFYTLEQAENYIAANPLD